MSCVAHVALGTTSAGLASSARNGRNVDDNEMITTIDGLIDGLTLTAEALKSIKEVLTDLNTRVERLEHV